MRNRLAIALALTAAAATAQAQPVKGPWIVTCDVGAASPAAPDTLAGQRVFRVGAGVFQAWNPDSKAFGNNLCDAFPCVRRPDRLEGTISSASMTLTISLSPQTGQAAWRTTGASGLSRPSGPCTVRPDKP